jgi:hypothetical protein
LLVTFQRAEPVPSERGCLHLGANALLAELLELEEPIRQLIEFSPVATSPSAIQQLEHRRLDCRPPSGSYAISPVVEPRCVREF